MYVSSQRTAAAAERPRSRRQTQAERRARSRSALLEAAARGLSRYGYGHLRLEEVVHVVAAAMEVAEEHGAAVAPVPRVITVGLHH